MTTENDKTLTVEELYAEKALQRETQAQTLLAIGEQAELFTSREGDAYTTITLGRHRATWSLSSDEFKNWLTYRLVQVTGKPAYGSALSAARNYLAAKASIEGATHAVHTRVGGHDGAVYVDLGDDSWRAIEITADGWAVVEDPPAQRGGQEQSARRLPASGPSRDAAHPCSTSA